MMKDNKMMKQLEQYLSSRLIPGSVIGYLYAINRFLNLYPNAMRLKLSAIESYFASLKEQNQSVGYRNSTQAAIKAYYDFLLEFEYITEHPCKQFKITEKRPTGKDFNSFLTMAEMEILLTLKQERFKNVGNKNKVIIGFLIYQGMTRQELVKLKLSDIDLENGFVKITGSKKNKSRTLALKPNQITFLMRYIEEDRPKLLKVKSNKLLISMRGAPMTSDAIHSFINRLDGAFDKEVSPMNIRK